ncbi:MAG: hypothetical protein AAGB48_10450 [Planctomycetota bacterium]
MTACVASAQTGTPQQPIDSIDINPFGENCPPLSCAGVSVGPFQAPEGWALKPDRRPVVVLQLRNGNPNNPLGISPSWYDDDFENPDGPPTDDDLNGIPDVFDWLLNQLDVAYDLGYRRMVMRLPAGSLRGGPMTSSQWWPMPEWKRDGFEMFVAAWLAEKNELGDPVSLGVYAGYPINDPCEWSMTGARYPDPTVLADVCAFYRNVKPWMDVGVKEYWLDASGPDWPTMATFQHSPDYAGKIRFGGEAIPNIGPGNGCGGQKTPDPGAVAASPFVALFSFVVSRFGLSEPVDPMATQLGVMFNGHHVQCGASEGQEWQFPDLRRIQSEGWVPWIDGLATNSQWRRQNEQAPYQFDYSFKYGAEGIHRIYDFGTLTAIIDFNNDGLIEVRDYDEPDLAAFLDAWYDNAMGPGTYLEGDVNGDDVVDAADVSAFFAAISDWNQNGTLVGVDLGPAPWHP